MKELGGSKLLIRAPVIALVAGLAWMIPTQSAFGCHIFAFQSATYSVAENSSKVTVVVTRDGGGATSSVRVTTADDSAEGGKDYTESTQDVSFSETETEKSIEIQIKDDSAYEGAETFNVRLSTTGGSPCATHVDQAYVYGNASTVTIQDNDPPPSAASPSPGSKPLASPKPGTASSAPPATKNPSPVASPTDEEVGPNVSGDVPKQKNSGPPVKAIILIVLIVLGVGGGIGLYYYLGTRD